MIRLPASTMKKILIVCFILTVIGVCAAFAYGLQIIRDYAISVTQTTQDAAASATKVEQLAAIQARLASTQVVVTKSSQLYATPGTYQTSSITDLQRYASSAGISINNIGFPAADESLPNSRPVSVSISNPVSYERFARFLQLVESSLPKMNVTSVTIAKLNPVRSDQVTVTNLVINISVKV